MIKDQFKDNSDYVTFREAVEMVCKSPHTFRKYAERIRVCGTHIGRNTYYRREDIEYLREFITQGAQDLIARLEAMTGGKVEIRFEKDKS